MQRCEHDRLVYYRFDSFPGDAVRHGVFTRLGGVSRPPFATLNLGRSVGDDPDAIDQNYARICAALAVRTDRVVTSHQVHGNRVAPVGPQHGGKLLSETDALITDSPAITLALRFADCVPVVLVDPVRGAVGLAHAGWKGTLLRIAARTVEAMIAEYGSRPGDILAGIGPSIGPCCYQIKDDVAALVRKTFGVTEDLLEERAGAMWLDLWAANRRVLNEAGVARVELSELCTSCRCDEFFSHRREDGRTGRAGVFVGLR